MSSAAAVVEPAETEPAGPTIGPTIDPAQPEEVVEDAAILLPTDPDAPVHALDDAPVPQTSIVDMPREPIVGRDTEARQLFESICDEVGKVVVGQRELVEGTLVALFSGGHVLICLLYTSPSPRDQRGSRMPSSA